MELDILDTAIGICAKRKSGKSELVRYIIHNYSNLFKRILVISPSEGVNNYYKNIPEIDQRFIYPAYDESLIEKLFKSMEFTNASKKKEEKEHILLILDDCCSDFNTHSSSSFKKLFTRGRHLGITVIVVQQYIYHVPPICRTNCDYVLVSQMNNQGLDILTNEYRMGSIEVDEFKKMYLRSTSNYGFLLINNNCASDNDNLNEIYGCIRVPKEFVDANK